MNKFTKAVGFVFVTMVMILGLNQLLERSELLGKPNQPPCCNNGHCTGLPCTIDSFYYPKKEDGDCDYTVEIPLNCILCINLQREDGICNQRNRDAYCCLIDTEPICPQQHRYYVCPPLSVSISGPTQLPSGQSGTFTANVGGGTPAFSYQWYKKIICSARHAAPCNQWYALSNSNSSSIQTSEVWDFYLKVTVTDNCFQPRIVTSSEIYVTIFNPAGTRKIAMIEERPALSLEGWRDGIGAYPNPFNASTTISFSLPEANRVSIAIYNTHGQQIKNLLSNQEFGPGIHTVRWDGKKDTGNEVSSGTYLCQLTIGSSRRMLRLALIK